MTSQVNPWKILIALILIALVFFALMSYQFDKMATQSERHMYRYSIDLSYDTTIDNVTLYLPVPERNSTPLFTESLLNGTAYGVSPDWNLSIVHENGTPMLAIQAARMVPEYHGYPIRIEPGATVLPTTLVPGHEYSSNTPILQPVSIVASELITSAIDTRSPVDHEPVFFPRGVFTPGTGIATAYNGPVYDHKVPVYIRYTSERPAAISLRIGIHGSNMIWRGGWESNSYSDSVVLETTNGTQGWVMGEGKLSTADGVYY
ncbi:MAG: hypothetical protein CVV30_02840 [Methanomicrobiales archaeon HGW-Methanomicrobiales-1]|jgi:hypothetical protein|nr:MAG: hypothetical protein CVV30_02840 [Methanomicrobiales archaeon HGW-Methanomicrobiales-1]